MKQHLKSILLIQIIVFAAFGVFAKTSNIDSSGHKMVFASFNDTADATNSSKKSIKGSLISFKAAYESNAVDLHWKITPGNNYDHFDIERSLDGVNFENAGEVKVTGPANADYSFTDYVRPVVARKNDLYYRLKQVDENNKSSYSKLLIVRTYNSKSVAAVSVTPDPSVNDIEVNVQLKENSYIVMKITNDDGKELMRKSVHGTNGVNTFSLTGTSQLQHGVYSLEIIINSNERMTMKLVKS